MKTEIFIQCPVCVQQGYNNKPEYWRHKTDGGKLYLDDYAYVSCGYCGISAPLVKMRLQCERGIHSYIIPNPTAFASAILKAGQLVDSMGQDWLLRVMIQIKNQ